MPTFLACYDLRSVASSAHGTFLALAPVHGWKLWIAAGADKYRLPNTTLAGDFGNRQLAVQALENLRLATAAEVKWPVTLPKWIVANCSEWQVDSEEKAPLKE